jgi:hypothetical protein
MTNSETKGRLFTLEPQLDSPVECPLPPWARLDGRPLVETAAMMPAWGTLFDPLMEDTHEIHVAGLSR